MWLYIYYTCSTLLILFITSFIMSTVAEKSRFSLKKYRGNESRSVKGYNLQEKKRSLTNSILDL